jgi:hypothetical protein
MTANGSLAQLQQWLLAAILHPGDVTAVANGGRTPVPSAFESDDVTQIVASSSGLSPVERLAVYQRGYRLRLLDCMRTLHPGLCHALGYELFDQFALDYLDENPSRARTLQEIDRGFPDYLAATAPAGDPDMSERETWPRFIIDLARLERLFAEVYDGPGIERHRILTAHEVPEEPSAAWLTVAFQATPCLRLMQSNYPVHVYLSAVHCGELPDLPSPRAVSIAVSRRDYVVTLTELGRDEYRALSVLAQGKTIQIAAASLGIPVSRIWSLIRGWVGQGFLQAVGPDRSIGVTIDHIF